MTALAGSEDPRIEIVSEFHGTTRVYRAFCAATRRPLSGRCGKREAAATIAARRLAPDDRIRRRCITCNRWFMGGRLIRMCARCGGCGSNPEGL